MKPDDDTTATRRQLASTLRWAATRNALREVDALLARAPRTAPWGDNSQAARHRESADGIERGPRALDGERRENTDGHGRATVARRARSARDRGLMARVPEDEWPRRRAR